MSSQKITDPGEIERLLQIADEQIPHLYPGRGPWELQETVYEVGQEEWPEELHPHLVAHVYTVTVRFPLFHFYVEDQVDDEDKSCDLLVVLPASLPVVFPLEPAKLALPSPSPSPERTITDFPEGAEGLLAFLSYHCGKSETPQNFYFVPNGQFGPTTLQPQHKQDFLSLCVEKHIQAQHTTNSPWETWEVSLPKENVLSE